MKTIQRSWAATVTFTAILCLVGCSKPPGKTVISGGGAISGDFSISSANLVVVEPQQPAVAWNMVQPPGEGRRIAYFMILKYPPQGGSSQGYSGDVSNDGRTGRSAGTITINGKDLSFDYRATIETGKGLKEELLSIKGIDQPLEKGRVFLIDLTADPISVVQHDLKLPKDVPDASSATDAEALAKSTLAELEKSSAVSEFIKHSGPTSTGRASR